MAGNVYEWCNDFFGEDYYQECYDNSHSGDEESPMFGVVVNPRGPASSFGHVIRGSAFLYETFKLRSAYRGAYYPSFRGAYIGIRCACDVSFRTPDDIR